jgi:hypothetical protein
LDRSEVAAEGLDGYKYPMIRRVVLAAVFLAIGSLLLRADAPDFTALLASNPKLNRWLTVQMVEDGDGPKKSYTASGFASSTILWHQGDEAIYWAIGNPPTEATNEQFGVLVAAKRNAAGIWKVMKSIRLEATGKDALATAELTESASVPEYDVPVVVVTLTQGGRGYAYNESFTYSMKDDNFILHQPEGQSPLTR